MQVRQRDRIKVSFFIVGYGWYKWGWLRPPDIAPQCKNLSTADYVHPQTEKREGLDVLGQDFLGHLAVDIRQAKLPTGIGISQLLVIQPK